MSETTETRTSKAKQWTKDLPPFVVPMILTILVALAVVIYLSWDSTPAEAEALTESNKLYEDYLDSPGSAEWASFEDSVVEYLGEDRYFIDTYVDSQNLNGAMIRTDYEMRISKDDDEWIIDEIDHY